MRWPAGVARASSSSCFTSLPSAMMSTPATLVMWICRALRTLLTSGLYAFRPAPSSAEATKAVAVALMLTGGTSAIYISMQDVSAFVAAWHHPAALVAAYEQGKASWSHHHNSKQ